MASVSSTSCSGGGDGGGGNNPGTGNTGGGSSNNLAPEFKGIVFSSATDLDKIVLAWLPAKDDITPTPEINYEVYASEIENFSPEAKHLKTTLRGEMQTLLEGLSPGTTYHLLVLAVDEEGNKSAERAYVQKTTATKAVELSATVSLAIAKDLGLGVPQINGNEYKFQNTGAASLPEVGDVLVGESATSGFIRKVDQASIAGKMTIPHFFEEMATAELEALVI